MKLSLTDLFILRTAALEWLHANPLHPTATDLREAIQRTTPPDGWLNAFADEQEKQDR